MQPFRGGISSVVLFSRVVPLPIWFCFYLLYFPSRSASDSLWPFTFRVILLSTCYGLPFLESFCSQLVALCESLCFGLIVDSHYARLHPYNYYFTSIKQNYHHLAEFKKNCKRSKVVNYNVIRGQSEYCPESRLSSARRGGPWRPSAISSMAASISSTTPLLPRDRLATARALCLASALRSTISLPLLRMFRSRPLAATMSVQAPEKSPSIAFLDRKESDFLHFVKYQGLGNDFIMVSDVIFFLLPFRSFFLFGFF